MGKKKKKKLPYKVGKVRDLPVGKGRVIVVTKKGNQITVEGAIVLKSNKKHLVVPVGNDGNSRDCALSFGDGTRVIKVKRWEPRPEEIPRVQK